MAIFECWTYTTMVKVLVPWFSVKKKRGGHHTKILDLIDLKVLLNLIKIPYKLEKVPGK